jgi:hypothetical protein
MRGLKTDDDRRPAERAEPLLAVLYNQGSALGMLCEPAFAALGPVFDRIAVRATAARYQLTLSWKNMSR